MHYRAGAFLLMTLMPNLALSETSTVFKGACENGSVVRTTVLQQGKKTPVETPVACDGALVPEQNDGSAIVSFLFAGNPNGPMQAFSSPGFAQSTRPKNLFVSGIYRLENRNAAQLELTPSVGRCEFSHEPIKDSTWIRCFAQTNDLERSTTVTFAAVPIVPNRRPPEAAAPNKGHLIHNGSEVIAIAEQGRMRIYYEKPKQSLVDAGVYQGTLLFQGTANDGHIKGTAFAFKKGCPPSPYDVEGVAQGDVGFELSGPGPQFGKGCAVVGRPGRALTRGYRLAPTTAGMNKKRFQERRLRKKHAKATVSTS